MFSGKKYRFRYDKNQKKRKRSGNGQLSECPALIDWFTVLIEGFSRGEAVLVRKEGKRMKKGRRTWKR